MTDPAEVAVINLTNNTDTPLKVGVVIGGVERHIVTLEAGQTTRQLTTSGISWTFSPAEASTESQATPATGAGEAAADPSDEEVDKDGGSKSGRGFD